MFISDLEAQLRVQRTPRARLAALAGLIAGQATKLWRAFQNRRSVKQLLEWDANMLKDIGLTRGDVVAAMSGSLRDDPAYRLSVLSVERRAASRAMARERLEASGRLVRLPRRQFDEERVKILEI